MFLKNQQSGGHREWLVRFLLRRACTEREVLERLAERGVSEEDAQVLVSELREMQFIDDVAYARLFLDGHEGWGLDRIACELTRRGVSQETIRSVLEDCEEEPSARELVKRWLATGLDERNIVGRLRRRGFSSHTIRSLLRRGDETPW